MLKISSAISNTDLKPALVPFITAGYPSLDITAKVLTLLDKQNVNAVELGIPYSDALADGIVIQEASRVALNNKVDINQIFILIGDISNSISMPIIIFTYFNPVLSRGISAFVKELAESGAQGLVIPDLPFEEADYLIRVCNYYDIELILFISPASTEERIKETLSKAPGCIYLVSSYGVTGLRDRINSNVSNLVKIIKQKSNKLIMLGFGIANEKNVKEIVSFNLGIDAIVMGSAFIKQIKDSCNNDNYSNIGIFCEKIRSAIMLN